MNIAFSNDELRQQCTVERERVRAFGKIRSKALGKRLDDLDAAENLAVMFAMPGRFHPLTGDRAGQFALDVGQPYRLILVPDHEPVPLLEDGSIALDRITAIRIIEVTDYHD